MGFPSFPTLLILFVKGTTGMTKFELGLFYIKIKMHLKIILLPTKQAITGQVIKSMQQSNFER